MGIKLKSYGNDADVFPLLFHCPGCDVAHPFDKRWTWNGSYTLPTFTPSLLCNQSIPGKVCHSFVTDGRIQFLGDCSHKLAGQTVDLPDWEELKI
jgi:uncharacterized protein DUF6527